MSVCFSDETEASSVGNFYAGPHKQVGLSLVGCNSTRRSTCKSPDEIEALLRRSTIEISVLRNVVVEDEFSNDKVETSRFTGDSNHYFPIHYTRHIVYRDLVLKAERKSNALPYNDFRSTINKLQIDDYMLSYGPRSTYFINHPSMRSGTT